MEETLLEGVDTDAYVEGLQLGNLTVDETEGDENTSEFDLDDADIENVLAVFAE